MIPKRHSQSNNKYMGEKFNPSKPSKYIQYLDANNFMDGQCVSLFQLEISSG